MKPELVRYIEGHDLYTLFLIEHVPHGRSVKEWTDEEVRLAPP